MHHHLGKSLPFLTRTQFALYKYLRKQRGYKPAAALEIAFEFTE